MVDKLTFHLLNCNIRFSLPCAMELIHTKQTKSSHTIEANTLHNIYLYFVLHRHILLALGQNQN